MLAMSNLYLAHQQMWEELLAILMRIWSILRELHVKLSTHGMEGGALYLRLRHELIKHMVT